MREQCLAKLATISADRLCRAVSAGCRQKPVELDRNLAVVAVHELARQRMIEKGAGQREHQDGDDGKGDTQTPEQRVRSVRGNHGRSSIT